MKHLPFQSIYKANFEVVEERDGRFTLYPHHEQLPALLRALNLEFYGGLPGRIARVDARDGGFNKIVLKTAALMFCTGTNAARPDGLHLYPLADANLVSKITIVQQITESTRRGRCHRFRFYGGPEFHPEICLNGKPVVFADHVLERFSTRVPNHLGENLTMLLLAFFGTPLISMPVGPGRAFVITYLESVLAFTYQESDMEYFITTCLTINEMNTLEREVPVRACNLHYGRAFTRPRIRHWLPTGWMTDLHKRWERKVPLPPPHKRVHSRLMTWHRFGSWVKDLTTKHGHGQGSQLFFLDHIPGPCLQELRPGQPEPRVDEIQIYYKLRPQYDWEAIFAQIDGATPAPTPPAVPAPAVDAPPATGAKQDSTSSPSAG